MYDPSGPADLAHSVVTAAPAGFSAGSSTTVTLTAEDANGNVEPSGGLSVAFSLAAGSADTTGGTFSNVTVNGDGTYTATFSSIVIGVDYITASIDGQALTSTPAAVTVSFPPFISLSQSIVTAVPTSFGAGGSTTVTFTVEDANGDVEPGDGLPVVFSLAAGSADTSGGTFSNVTDNGDGTYTATFSSTVPGTDYITASIDGEALTSTPATVTALDLSHSTVAAVPTGFPAGGSTTVTLTTEDTNGDVEPSGGQSVAFNLADGSADTSGGTFSDVTDNGDGTYTATFMSTVAGTDYLTASINGQPLISTPAAVTVAPTAFSLSQSTVTAPSSIIPLGGSSTITLTPEDQYGNLLPTGITSVAFSLAAGSSSGTFGAVTLNANGTYTATFTSTSTIIGVATIHTTIDGQAVTSTPAAIDVTAPVGWSSGGTLATRGMMRRRRC